MQTEDILAPASARDLSSSIAVANIPTLLPVLVQLTGDERWIGAPYRPTRARGIDDNDDGGLPVPVQDEIRAAAETAITRWLRGAPVALPDPPHDLLVRMLSTAVSEPVPLDYGHFIEAELGSSVSGAIVAPSKTDLRVIVIGGGVSGICAAASLERAGIDYVVIEKSDGIGGTWLDNRYPGAGVDTPNHLYSFSFAPYRWTRYFSLRDELVEYLEHVVDLFVDRDRIRLRCEVLRASFDSDSKSWRVDVRQADGTVSTLESSVVISAVGAFNPPLIPAIEGLSQFDGPLFHTAQWPQDLDLSGKRLAIVGNGASAMQVAPAVAGRVASLDIYQRTPQWAAPFAKFQQEVPDGINDLLEAVPLYQQWYRIRLGWIFNDRLHASLQKDPGWAHPDRSLNETNEAHRRFLTRYMESELSGRPDLLEKVVPSYPPYGKRMLLDNGWFRMLKRPNVELIDSAVKSFTSSSICTEDGGVRPVDIVAIATGFDVLRFVSSYDVYGRSGRTLRETWSDDDCKAYLGVAVPDFPNFFTLYGPNTQPGHGGSLVSTLEAQMHYVMAILERMARDGIRTVEVRTSAYEAYAETVDSLHENMVWTHSGSSSYYRNSRGRVVVNSPYRNIDFWKMTRSPRLEDFEMI